MSKRKRNREGRQVRHNSDAVVMLLLAGGTIVAWANWWPASILSKPIEGGFVLPPHAFGVSNGEIGLAAVILLTGAVFLFLIPTRVRIVGAVLAAIASVVLVIDAGTAFASAYSAYSNLNHSADASGTAGLLAQSVFQGSLLPAGGALLGGLMIFFGALHLVGDGLRVARSNQAPVASERPLEPTMVASSSKPTREDEHIQCSSCGEPLRAQGSSCGACGASREHSKLTDVVAASNTLASQPVAGGTGCASCGHPNLGGARFCGGCGVSLATATPSSTRSAEIPPSDSSLWV